MEWIQRVVDTPDREERQKDGRIRRWAWISEVKKHLRVVLLEDGQTIHNAFFDRDYKDSSDED